jgi:hypothetical protein
MRPRWRSPRPPPYGMDPGAVPDRAASSSRVRSLRTVAQLRVVTARPTLPSSAPAARLSRMPAAQCS